jgi:hypothetical protein
MSHGWAISVGLALAILLVGGPVASAQQVPAGGQTAQAAMFERTPPRLAYLHGEVAFWRPGADDWTPARLNTPLAPGDVLYTGSGGNLEIQIGARAFVRASWTTQLGLDNQEPDYLQFRVPAGHVSLDLRELPPGHTIELNTPNAAFIVERTGYYRVDVGQDTTVFVARRGGRATMTTATGPAVAITPSEQVVITGTDSPRVETYVAPELSDWDRWNYTRTDQLMEAMSARYVSPSVYGVDDLDHYGTWRVVADYGPVWVPDATPAGWAPYSTGHWTWDPYYGWTWIDDAPWGWAPYHYGRWVFLDGFWAWAPGPLVGRPVYAPALVGFFGWGVGIGRPIGWVALSWGEPLIPWWGPVGFIGTAWWGGWGGPRIVNNVVISHTTIVNVANINYRNAGVGRAVVAVPAERFGRGQPVASARVPVDPRALTPIQGALGVRPDSRSLAPGTGRAVRPPEAVQQRRVVATRPPHDVTPALRAEGLGPGRAAPAVPPPRVVVAPAAPDATATPPRPPFGGQDAPERPRPPRPPRFEAPAGAQPAPSLPRRSPEATVPRVEPGSPGGPRPSVPRREVQPAPTPVPRAPTVRPPGLERPEPSPVPRWQPPAARAPEPQVIRPAPSPQAPPSPEVRPGVGRSLPGEPANRLYQGQPTRQGPRLEQPHSSPGGSGRGTESPRRRGPD